MTDPLVIALALIPALVAAGAAVLFFTRSKALEQQVAALSVSRREVETTVERKIESRRRELLESVFLALGDACLLIDEELKVVLANDRLRAFFPGPPITAGRRLQDIVSDHRIVDLAGQCLRDRREIQDTFEVRSTVDGKTKVHWLTANVAPVRLQGEFSVHHLRVIIRDISQQRETEQIRKDFVANASHELRTPLSIINGYLENLIDGVIDTPAGVDRALHAMQKHGDRLARIVEDMLTISRFESVVGDETERLLSSVFDCRECVEDVVDRLHPLIDEKEADVRIVVDDADRWIRGDRFYWEQVFFNLIENALKENREKHLKVDVMLERRDDGSIEITVRDNGVGIPRADLPFIFKRFYRVAKHHGQDVKGTGLGLSIVKRAVEAHRGTIDVRSTPGQETAFVIRLPAAAAGVPPPSPAADPEDADSSGGEPKVRQAAPN